MNEETLWTRAYGDEYWADVTSPLFFSLLGEYLTEYVMKEDALPFAGKVGNSFSLMHGLWQGTYSVRRWVMALLST